MNCNFFFVSSRPHSDLNTSPSLSITFVDCITPLFVCFHCLFLSDILTQYVPVIFYFANLSSVSLIQPWWLGVECLLQKKHDSALVD